MQPGKCMYSICNSDSYHDKVFTRLILTDRYWANMFSGTLHVVFDCDFQGILVIILILVTYYLGV